MRRMDGLRRRSRRLERKNLLPLPGFQHRTVQPVA
jgi:hypothetical protein